MSNIMFGRCKAFFAICGLGQAMPAPMRTNAPAINSSLSTASVACLDVDTVSNTVDSIHTLQTLSTFVKGATQPKSTTVAISTVSEAYAKSPSTEYLNDVSVEIISARDVVPSFLMPTHTAFPAFTHTATFARGEGVVLSEKAITQQSGIQVISDVTTAHMDGCHVTEVTPDNRVSIFSQDAQHDDVACEQAMMQPVVSALPTQSRTEVYVLSKEEGGRPTPYFNGLRPQFYFRTTDVIGAANLSNVAIQSLSGDGGNCSVKPAQASDTVRTQQMTPFFTQPVATGEYSKVVN